jgi:hypothetical protein
MTSGTCSSLWHLQELLRAVVDICHVPFYRDRLVSTCFKGTVYESMMNTWSAGNLTLWRWSSLVTVLKCLLPRKGPLQSFWSLAKFTSKVYNADFVEAAGDTA